MIPVYHGGDIHNPEIHSEEYDLGCPSNLLPKDMDWASELERCKQQGRLPGLGNDFSNLSPYILGRVPSEGGPKSRRRSRQMTRLAGPAQSPEINRLSARDGVMAKAVQRLMADIRGKGYQAVPILDDDWISIAQPTGFEVISLTSTNAVDIDTRKLSWSAINEFRQDGDSQKKLRNYRMFWVDTYAERDRYFVEDDLSRRYEQFQRACAKHGFDTYKAGLTALVNSKSLLAGSALALTAAIVGAPTGLPELLAGGAVTLELATISLEISNSRISHRQYVEDNDLAYLHKINRALRTDI